MCIRDRSAQRGLSLPDETDVSERPRIQCCGRVEVCLGFPARSRNPRRPRATDNLVARMGSQFAGQLRARSCCVEGDANMGEQPGAVRGTDPPSGAPRYPHRCSLALNPVLLVPPWDSLEVFTRAMVLLSLIHISEPTRLGMISY